MMRWYVKTPTVEALSPNVSELTLHLKGGQLLTIAKPCIGAQSAIRLAVRVDLDRLKCRSRQGSANVVKAIGV